MRTWILAFLAGILAVLRLQTLPPAWIVIVFLIISICLSFFLRTHYRWLAGLVAGACWAIFCAQQILADVLPVALESEPVIAVGRIVSLPEQRERGVRFEFDINKLIDARGVEHPGPGKVRLHWYQHAPELIPGQLWRLRIKLKRPHGFMNPGGFDYEAWLFQHRIRASGYVVHDRQNLPEDVLHGQWINRIRYHLRQRVIEQPESNEYAGLVLALSLGDRSNITPLDREIMIRTGTNHLLAISGLHISLVAGLFYFVTRRLWAYAGRWPLFLPAPRAAIFAAILAAVSYSLLAGMSVPTQRSMIMVIVVMLGIWGGRQYPVSSVLCAALFMVLLFDPFAVMDAGFWLSFTAVAVIVYGMSNRINTRSLWWKWGRTQLLAAIGLLAPLIYLFGQYSLTGFAANLVAIPWVSFITVPLSIAGTVMQNISTPLANICLGLAQGSLALLWPFLELLAQPQFAVWHHSTSALWPLLMAMLGALILLMPSGLPARWTGLLWMLPLIYPQVQKPDQNNEVWFTLLDVGQGLAAVVRTQEHTLVYDTGAKFTENFNSGDAVVVPYLRRLQTKHVDKLIISHADNDHIGGADAVLAAWPGTPVSTSVPEHFRADQVHSCKAGQHWQWDGVEFSFLHPGLAGPGHDNNLSCVLKVSAAGRTILLSGDIEKEAERYLVTHFRAALVADVLIAPHHGSLTSSTPEFINAVDPEWVLFPVGYRNRFNFPNEAIIARYAARDIQMLDTARHGAIEIKIAADGMTVTRHRQEARRFWHTIVD